MATRPWHRLSANVLKLCLALLALLALRARLWPFPLGRALRVAKARHRHCTVNHVLLLSPALIKNTAKTRARFISLPAHWRCIRTRSTTGTGPPPRHDLKAKPISTTREKEFITVHHLSLDWNSLFPLLSFFIFTSAPRIDHGKLIAGLMYSRGAREVVGA